MYLRLRRTIFRIIQNYSVFCVKLRRFCQKYLYFHCNLAIAMGRKSQSKQTAKKNSGKEINKYELQKRKNLAVLVDRLLKLTSIFQTSLTPSKLWDHHLEIESLIKQIRALECPKTKLESTCREEKFQQFLKWLNENGANYEGVEICEFEGMNFGLRATKPFPKDSLILNVPKKLMMTETDAKESALKEFIATDPVLQNMPNITLALFLLFEKNKGDSFWKPYIDILPDTYTTVLYFISEELAELKPSPVLESSLKLIRSISRQYSYFWSKIHSLDLPELNNLQEIFTFDNYRWAVSTVMTRQNNIKLENMEVTAFIPLWDMCNHEQGVITTNFNVEKGVSECFAQRDFGKDEQTFIYYGIRPNADLFLHNGFVYRANKDDKLPLVLGISSSDVHRDLRLSILQRLGLGNVTHFSLYKMDNPLPPALLAFIRVFTMNEEELNKWSSESMPSDLVSSEPSSSDLVGPEIDRKAYKYLLTRCNLLKLSYKSKEDKPSETQPKNIHLENIKALKECEVQILDGAINYLQGMIDKLPAEIKGIQ